MKPETQPNRVYLLQDMEKAIKDVAASSNGHDPIAHSDPTIYHSLVAARDLLQDNSRYTVDPHRHVNGALNNRNVVYDAAGGRMIMRGVAFLALSGAKESESLRKLSIDRDTILQASSVLFGEPETPSGE